MADATKKPIVRALGCRRVLIVECVLCLPSAGDHPLQSLPDKGMAQHWPSTLKAASTTNETATQVWSSERKSMANPAHLAILEQGVEAWNQWRRENIAIKPNLKGANLKLVTLNQVNFSGTFLKGAKLNGATLKGADLSSAHLVKTDLSEANLKGSDLRGAKLIGVKLRGVILSEAKLQGAHLQGRNLTGADLSRANLGGADLRWADLSGACLKEANLNGANLEGANLINADLSNAGLNKVTLSNTKLGRTDLSGVNLTQTDLSGVILRGMLLRGTYLSGARLSNTDLRDADLGGADLSKADLNRAELLKADLHGANLSEADLRHASLNGADLRYANLVNANLNSAGICDANLGGADLRQADLHGADLRRTDLRGATLIMASLQTSCLIDAKLDGANLTGAHLWETQRAGWSIKGVICESVYWDKEGKEKTTYAPGEFERLFADQFKIRLVYADGITLLEIATLPALIKHLEGTHPGAKLRFVNIHEGAGGAVVELAIEATSEQSAEQVKQLQTTLQPEAQDKAEQLRAVFAKQERVELLENKVEQLDVLVHQLLNQPKQPTTIHVNQGGSMATYNISGQAGAVGTNAHADHNTFTQTVNHVDQAVDMGELAKQLGELRQAIMQKQDGSTEAGLAIGNVTAAELAAKDKNTSKVLEHLRAAGKWTLDFARDIGKDLVVDVIKKAMGTP